MQIPFAIGPAYRARSGATAFPICLKLPLCCFQRSQNHREAIEGRQLRAPRSVSWQWPIRKRARHHTYWQSSRRCDVIR